MCDNRTAAYLICKARGELACDCNTRQHLFVQRSEFVRLRVDYEYTHRSTIAPSHCRRTTSVERGRERERESARGVEVSCLYVVLLLLLYAENLSQPPQKSINRHQHSRQTADNKTHQKSSSLKGTRRRSPCPLKSWGCSPLLHSSSKACGARVLLCRRNRRGSGDGT